MNGASTSSSPSNKNTIILMHRQQDVFSALHRFTVIWREEEEQELAEEEEVEDC